VSVSFGVLNSCEGPNGDTSESSTGTHCSRTNEPLRTNEPYEPYEPYDPLDPFEHLVLGPPFAELPRWGQSSLWARLTMGRNT